MAENTGNSPIESAMAGTGSTDWTQYIKNPLILALLGVLGNYQNQQQAEDVYTPKQAMEGVTNLQNNPFTSQLTSALNGTPASATTSAVQGAVTDRMNQSFTAPSLNMPTRYNPYADANSTMGNVNPELLQNVLALANKQTISPTDTTYMQNNLANRGSTDARSAMLANLQNRGTPEANAAMLANLQNRGNDTLFNNLYNRYSQRFGG